MSSSVTQTCEFECCYLIGTKLNAHRYKVEVTVDGPQREEDFGYVLEFTKFSEYLNSVVPNNTFIFDTTSQNSGRDIAFILGQRGVSITGVSFSLSAENLCNYIATTLQDILDYNEPGLRVINVRLRENNNSFVTWRPN